VTARRPFDSFIAVAVTGVLAAALATLPLAMLGIFRPYYVFPLLFVLWAGLFVLHQRGPSEETPVAAGPVVLVFVLVFAFALVNGRYASQHLLTNRDPGVYNTTARWLADHGNLLVNRDDTAYADLPGVERVRFDAGGYYEKDAPPGKLYAQFAHLFPSLIAAVSWIGGTSGMLRTNVVLGALALLFFFAFCARLMPPWIAALATVALAVNPLQNHFARDAYTEITSQLFLFAALWMLWSARRTLDRGKALIAGLLWGAMCMARIDAFTLLVPLAAYVFYELWVGAGAASPRDHRAFLVRLVAGTAVTSAIGALDLGLFSPVYVYDLRKQVIRIAAGLLLVCAGGSIALVLRRPLAPLRSWAGRNHVALAGIVVIVGALGALYAYVLRPHVELATQSIRNGLVEGLQGRIHAPVNGFRTYSEETMRWLGLYFGIPALASSVAGVLGLMRRTIIGRAKNAVPFLLVFVSMTALYLWQPAITPDQIWAMRRFLPVTVPGLIVGCFWLMHRVLRMQGNRALVLGAAAVVAAAAIAYPACVQADYMTARTQLGVLGATEALCDRLGPDAAVIVQQGKVLDRHYTQTVRAFCHIPTASVPPDENASWYQAIARRWKARGRTLYAIAPSVPFGPNWPIAMERFASFNYHDLQLTIEGRPHGRENTVFAIYLVRVPA
jgi:hypothetical protein